MNIFVNLFRKNNFCTYFVSFSDLLYLKLSHILNLLCKVSIDVLYKPLIIYRALMINGQFLKAFEQALCVVTIPYR